MEEMELKALVFDVMEKQGYLKLQYEYLEKQKQEIIDKLNKVRQRAMESAPTEVVTPITE